MQCHSTANSDPPAGDLPAMLAMLGSLRDVLLEESQLAKAIAMQEELAECRRRIAGPDAPETIAARADLGTLLMSSPEGIFEA